MKRGFTLVELLAVVLIVAILSGVGLPQYRKAVDKARVSEAQSMLRTIYDSSERVAGEFGYRSYEALLDAKSNDSLYGFSRLDMFDSDSLPTGCTISAGNAELVCRNFSYKISVLGNSVPYVVAKMRTGRYPGTLIVFNRSDGDIYCQEASSGADACEVFGLDTVSGITY